MNTITAQELRSLLTTGRPVDLIDVRSPAEYQMAHVREARLVPLDSLDPGAVREAPEGDDPRLHLICHSGSRARQAAEKLGAAGFDRVVLIEGGTQAWIDAGYPVVRGRKAISLERQVRIGAGSLVLLGIALGALVHPGLLGLSAFVGAGLVFAGVTDRCGMAAFLARMPWNRGSGPAPAAVTTPKHA